MEPFPLLLVVLDGLADWPAPELGGATPLEAAHTPNLDRLAREGASGLVHPLQPGHVPSSDLAHWHLFGYADVRFPGRAVLEALGRGVEVPAGVTVTHAALRSARRQGDALHLQGGYRDAEDQEGSALLASLAGREFGGVRFELRYLERGDALLLLHGDASPDLTDSDPFSTDRPVLAVQARAEAGDPERARATAHALDGFLRHAHRVLQANPINAERRRRGALPLNALVTKWSGRREDVPPLAHQVGGEAWSIASIPLYAGLAGLLGAGYREIPEGSDPEREVSEKVDAALEALGTGAGFVHLHTKAADEAAHQRKPAHKRDAIQAIDRGLGSLLDGTGLPGETVVAVVPDHATPSWGPLLHGGDAVPVSVRGPSVLVDQVEGYSERGAARGGLGTLRGRDVLPVLLNLAGRARFRGARHASRDGPAVPMDLPHLRVEP